jgi:hypothetical protein
MVTKNKKKLGVVNHAKQLVWLKLRGKKSWETFVNFAKC